MALDPSIILGVKPPTVAAPNPLDTLQAITQIQGLREQTEQRRLAADKARQTAADEAAIRNVMTQTGGDVDQALPLLRQINPRAAMDFQTNLGKQREAEFKGLKEKMEFTTKQFEVGDRLLAYAHDDPSFQVVRPMIAQLSPDIATQLGDTYDPVKVQGVRAMAQSAKERHDQEQDGLKLITDGKPVQGINTVFATADTPEKWAGFQQMATKFGVPPAILDAIGPYSPENVARAKQNAIAPEKQAELAGQAETRAAQAARDAQAAHSPAYKEWQDYQATGGTLGFDAYMTQDANRHRSVTQVNTGTTAVPGDFTRTGDAFLETIPAQWRATVKKIAAYEEDPTKVASMRGGMRETLMQWVNQANPSYDATVFGNRAPTRKAFTTGIQGRQINNINTAIGHLDQLTGLADQLQAGGFVPGNQAWNAIRTAFGSDKVTNFNTLKDALAGEVAGVLSQSGATVSGIADAQAKIQAANSPTQLAGYVKTLIPVMGSKLGSLDYQYHQAMGADDPFSALSPESVRILAKHGVDPAHLTGTPAAQPPAALSGKTSGDQTPRVGERRSFNGRIGEWDGRGWKAVP